ncbi:hypothetical protein [Herbaspirillum huttiense]|uniref:Uncharacterized protein n=2 Tax=Herbaspirillum huttiense TaxID=863372 RepID=A0AAJ2HDT7_9BURK|nr:hypothetical protein [Herbaspirillum huttiense]MDR9838210.1 hypothetical protein [Herbaspirillum huttiense]
MLESIRRMTPEVDRLISATYGIESLASQYQAAVRVREQIGRRLDGDVRAGGGDDFARRIGRINRQIVSFYAHHPNAGQYAAVELRGGEANVSREVLEVASNCLMGFETMVSYDNADTRDKLNALAHLQDIANNQLVSPLVIDAARRANNDPETLANNLLALVQRNPPVLSLHSRAIG